MDANGLKFWMLADERDWREGAGVYYSRVRRVLRLASERVLPALDGSRAPANSLLEAIPSTLDAFGTRAYYDAAEKALMVDGALPGAVRLRTFGDGLQPSDVAMGYDGVLYVVFEQARRILLIDRRERWDDFTLATGDFAPWRLAALPDGGVAVLDRNQQRAVAFVTGTPLPHNTVGEFAPETFRPREENPQPPTLTKLPRLVWPADETAAGLASDPSGRLALLTWPDDASTAWARLHTFTEKGEPQATWQLQGARFPYSFAWVNEQRCAVMLAGLEREAAVYELPLEAEGDGEKTLLPLGDTYPLRDYQPAYGPFLHGVTQPPHYPQRTGTLPLHALSLLSLAGAGAATNARALDSGSEQTAWHRLYLEAAIPAGCGVIVRLAASSDPVAEPAADQWYEHYFGERLARAGDLNLPRGAWVSQPSEIPFHPGLLPCPSERARAGLFTALIQRTGRRVRTLRGRYLHVQVQLLGDGRSTPEVAALRAYGSRFSYVSHYLPELFHEDALGDEAEAMVPRHAVTQRLMPTTRADFLERFVNNFESVLTPLEDRIAHAYLLTDPATANAASLEWLGQWVGLAFDQVYPPERRRALLQNAAELRRTHGTEYGLKLALDLATGGGVSGGEIIVLENFRLRRVLATILGADLADENDPLLGGFAISGNSFVGDTLVLGDETKREFLALFNAETVRDVTLPLSQRMSEERAIAAFFDQLAHRVTVLVHQEVEPQDLGLIRRVVELEAPAHVQTTVAVASYPLLVGLASLIGVDTYLRRRPVPRPARANGSRLNGGDFLLHPPSLDPRLHGGLRRGVLTQSDPPVADAGAQQTVGLTESFTLDGSGSRAAPGRRIRRYLWTWVN